MKYWNLLVIVEINRVQCVYLRTCGITFFSIKFNIDLSYKHDVTRIKIATKAKMNLFYQAIGISKIM